MTEKKKVELNEENLEGIAGGAGVKVGVDTDINTDRSSNKNDKDTAKNQNSQVTTKQKKSENNVEGNESTVGLQTGPIRSKKKMTIDLRN